MHSTRGEASWERAESLLPLQRAGKYFFGTDMTLNPYAKPFVFKAQEEEVPRRCDCIEPSAGAAAGSDYTIHATNAKLQRLKLGNKAAVGPELAGAATTTEAVARSKVVALDNSANEELTFDEVFDHACVGEPPSSPPYPVQVTLKNQQPHQLLAGSSCQDVIACERSSLCKTSW